MEKGVDFLTAVHCQGHEVRNFINDCCCWNGRQVEVINPDKFMRAGLLAEPIKVVSQAHKTSLLVTAVKTLSVIVFPLGLLMLLIKYLTVPKSPVIDVTIDTIKTDLKEQIHGVATGTLKGINIKIEGYLTAKLKGIARPKVYLESLENFNDEKVLLMFANVRWTILAKVIAAREAGVDEEVEAQLEQLEHDLDAVFITLCDKYTGPRDDPAIKEVFLTHYGIRHG